MINVFGIASNALGIANPMQDAILRRCTGSITEDDGAVTTTYEDVPVHIEVQATTGGDLQMLANIDQQADLRTVYMRGAAHGLSRALQTGGDLLIFEGSEWLITQILEQWGAEDWCKLAVTRQIPGNQTSS